MCVTPTSSYKKRTITHNAGTSRDNAIGYDADKCETAFEVRNWSIGFGACTSHVAATADRIMWFTDKAGMYSSTSQVHS